MSEGRRYAILIGNSRFDDQQSFQTLRCPENDAQGLADLMTSPELGLFTDPLVLKNQPHDAVMRAVNRVFKDAKRPDRILIYYSGHGKQDEEGHLHLAMTNTEADALEATSMPFDFLRRLINNYACKQVALILDCCYSGSVSKDLLKGGVNEQLRLMRGTYILTASTAQQSAREKDGDEYSLLTKHILNGIRQGEADYDDDGFVSMEDLFNYVTEKVPREAPQYPTKYELGVQGDQFHIARSFKVFPPERLRSFKEKILGIERYLSVKVFRQAYDVITDNQPKRDKGFFVLLEDLCEARLQIGEFSDRWHRLVLQQQPAPPRATKEPQPQTQKQAQDELLSSFIENLNGVPLEMIYVPGGTFKMGSPKGEGNVAERPQHEVTVPSFWIGKYQITQEQWQTLMGSNPSHFKGDKNLPVENVSWGEAKEFCKELLQMTGKIYRLPSEAEWEYACRAGTTGDYVDDLEAMGWYDKNSGSKTNPVGNKQPNAYGLYDMHGNVWEWCKDEWHNNYKGAPTDGSAWLRGGNSSLRVLRGGSWGSDSLNCRSAIRFRYVAGRRYYDIGFRIVCTARAK